MPSWSEYVCARELCCRMYAFRLGFQPCSFMCCQFESRQCLHVVEARFCLAPRATRNTTGHQFAVSKRLFIAVAVTASTTSVPVSTIPLTMMHKGMLASPGRRFRSDRCHDEKFLQCAAPKQTRFPL